MEILLEPTSNKDSWLGKDSYIQAEIMSRRFFFKLRSTDQRFDPQDCEVYGSSTHTTTDHYDIEWFKRGEALQAKKTEALKSTRAESSNANKSKTPTRRKPIWYLDNGCSRHMTGFKSYLHKYVEQLGPKVVFGDDSTCITEGYGSIKCNVYIHNHKDHLGKFDEKADDGYLLGYSLVSKAFRVFNTRRQQTEKTYHITFDESPNAIKFSKPSVDNINIAETKRYPPGNTRQHWEAHRNRSGNASKGGRAKNVAENKAENKLIKTPKNEEIVKASSSQPIAYYLKHKINEKLIKGLVNNNRFNNSRSGTRVGKKKGKEYKVSPREPIYDAILKKNITKKEDIRGNFKIPCSIGDLKHVNALIDQGSDVNIMPYSTYKKLTDERPVEVVEHVYPIDFVILDIKENEKRPCILGTPFLTTVKASIKFDKGTITLRSGKSKASLGMGRKDKASLGKGDEFNQWRSKNFKGKHPTLIATKEGMDDERRRPPKFIYDEKSLKGYLLEDKQIPSVEKAFGGNTRDLGSFGEVTDKTTDLHQHGSRISLQWLEMASQIERDAVTTMIKNTVSQDSKTASEHTTQPII
ncbi:zinc finger, CCHC-type containing protein [Tanacetum coccineum]